MVEQMEERIDAQTDSLSLHMMSDLVADLCNRMEVELQRVKRYRSLITKRIIEIENEKYKDKAGVARVPRVASDEKSR